MQQTNYGLMQQMVLTHPVSLKIIHSFHSFMKNSDLLEFISSVTSSAGRLSFPEEEAEKRYLNYYTSLTRSEKIQIHKIKKSIFEKLKNKRMDKNKSSLFDKLKKNILKPQEEELEILDYISLILAIVEAKSLETENINVRDYAHLDDPTKALPDFQEARLQEFLSERRSGPRKATQEIIFLHQGLIRRMIAQKASPRKIATFLEKEHGVTISHTTIYRNLKLIFKEKN